MYIVHGLELKDIVYFKKAKIALDKHPLVFVRGLNKDTADLCQPTSNGAGKSLLFSCPPNIFYFSPPAATRKNSKKELLRKGSENRIVFSNPAGVKYDVTQKSNGYVIKENGVDLQYKRIPDAEKFIRSVFPLTEIDYYTYCFVSTQRPYLMQSDTNANRLDHLTSLFRLDSYDVMRAHFVKQLANVKTSEMKLSVLEQRALDARVKLKKIKAKQKTSKTESKEDLKERQVALGKELEMFNAQVFSIEKKVTTLRTLKRIESELDVLRKKYKYKKKPDDMYKILVAERKLIRAYEKYEDALESYKTTVARTTKKMDALTLPKLSRKEIVSRLKKVDAAFEEQEEKLDGLKEIESRYKREHKKLLELQSEYDDLDIPKGSDITEDWQGELAQCLSTIKLEALLEHRHAGKKKGACPVCLSKLDLDTISKNVEIAKKRLPMVKTMLQAKVLSKQIKDALKVVDNQDTTQLEDELFESKKELEGLTKSKAKYKEQLKTIEAYKELKETLDSIEKPKKPKEEPTLGLSLDVVDSHIELCSDISKHLEAKSRLLENDLEAATCRSAAAVEEALDEKKAHLSKLEGVVAKTRKSLLNISEALEQASYLESELSVTRRNLVDLKKEIDELKPSVVDKGILETLVKAYSTKGLKTLVANEVCSLLETNLNFYRDLAFAEPFSFSVKASESGLSILVDRKKGATPVSDVRNLSGAESNSFRMLFLISTLVLIPDERRLNMVVLDEPCSHSDEVTRDIFLTRFLPALQEIVPNVYVITPHLNDQAVGSKDLIVKKENGVSTLHHSFASL